MTIDKSSHIPFRRRLDTRPVKPRLTLAETHWKLGKALALREKWSEAAIELRQAIALDNDWLEPQRELARVLVKLSAWDEAAGVLRGVAEESPEDSQTRHLLGDALSKLERWEEAVEAYRGAIALEPDFVWSHNNLGDALRQLERWEEAAEAYQNAIALKGDFVWSHNNLGDALFKLERWDEAAEAYQNAIALDKDSLILQRNLGKVLVKLSAWEDAVTLWQQVAEKSPNDSEVWHLLGDALSGSERWSEAVAAYQNAIGLNPEFSGSHNNLGDALLKLERWSEAVAAYQNAIGLNPEFFWSHNNLGDALLNLERWSEAAEAYQNAIGLNPEFFWSHNNLGDALLKLERWSEAAEAYQNAIGLNPEFFWSHNNLGDALLKLERWSEAAEAYQNAIAWRDDLPWSHYNLAEALVKLERWEAAVKAYKRAMEIQPDLPCIYEKLGDALRHQTQIDSQEICQVYHRAVEHNPTNLQVYYKALEVNPKDAKMSLKLADAFRSQGQLDQAVTFYKNTLQLTPEDVDIQVLALHRLGSISQNRGHLEEALGLYRRCGELSPGVDSGLALAAVLEKLGRWTDAVDQYRQVVLEFGECGPASLGLGRALAELERPVEAVVECRRAVKLGVETPEVHRLLAETLVELGRWSEVVEHWKWLLERYPGAAHWRRRLALALMGLGRWTEAAAQWGEYWRVAPGSGRCPVVDFRPQKKTHGEIDHSQELSITGDLTVEFWLYLRDWPKSWTDIISKYVNDQQWEQELEYALNQLGRSLATESTDIWRIQEGQRDEKLHQLLIGSHLDSPKNLDQSYDNQVIGIRGWVLPKDHDVRSVKIIVKSASCEREELLSVERTDVIRIKLNAEPEEHPQLFCGFNFKVTPADRIEIYISIEGYKYHWKTIESTRFPYNEFCFRLKDDQKGQWYYGKGEAVAKQVNWVPQEDMRLHEWVHVACVRKVGEYGRIYFNGVLRREKDWSGESEAVGTEAPVRLMGSPQWQRFHDGKLSEVRLWNLARSGDEIREGMCEGLTGEEPGLVGLWHGDESDEGILVDAVGHHHGRLVMASDAGKERPRVGVSSWELSQNAAGRAYTLAQLYGGFAEVELIGCLFPKYGGQVWSPIRGSEIPCHTIRVEDEGRFIEQALGLVLAHPYEVLHLSKPRMPNIILGLLYKLVWGARVIVDIDDEELAFVKASETLDLRELLESGGKLPPFQGWDGGKWTGLAVGLARAFDGVTVSNPALLERYGGVVIRHGRDEARFVPSADLKRRSRERFGIAQDKKVVLFFGTPRKHKGLVTTARALGSLGRKDVVFAIIGDFEDGKLKEELQGIPGVDYVFVGNQPFESIPDVVAVGDICVLLQDADFRVSQFQIPAKLSDALGMGLVVLLSETAAVADVIESGAVVPVAEGDLPAVLDRVLSDEAECNKFRVRGRELLAAEFGFGVNGSRLAEVMDEVRSGVGVLSDELNLLLAGFPAVGSVWQHWGEGVLETRRLRPVGQGVSIIVLSWNGAGLLRRLLSSFFATNTYFPVEFIIIDHGSEDNTAEVVRQQAIKGDVRYINRGANFSFSNSCNYGAGLAKYPYLLFLNNDIVFSSDVLPLAVSRLDDATIGAVGVRLDDEPSSLPKGKEPGVHHTGIEFVWNEKRGYFQPEQIRHGSLKDYLANATAEGDFFPAVTGAFLLCRKGDWERVGGFSLDYDYGLEDIDFCLRLGRDLRKKCYCINQVSLQHQEGATRQKGNQPQRREVRENNHRLFKERWDNYVRDLMGQPLVNQHTSANHIKLYASSENPKIAVVLHAYYPELLPELFSKLDNLSDYDLFVTIPENVVDSVTSALDKYTKNYQVSIVKNIGYDILPFLEVISELDTLGYKYVCKIHTKRDHPDFGSLWRECLLDAVLGDKNITEQIITAFDNNPSLQIVGPALLYMSMLGTIYDGHEKMKQMIHDFMEPLNLIEDWGFFGGSMFWSRITPLKYIADQILLKPIDWQASKSWLTTGFYYHIVERLLGLVSYINEGQVGLVDYKIIDTENIVKILRINQNFVPTPLPTEYRLKAYRLAKNNLFAKYALIYKSGIFDAFYYLTIMPHLLKDKIDCVEHYLTSNAKSYLSHQHQNEEITFSFSGNQLNYTAKQSKSISLDSNFVSDLMGCQPFPNKNFPSQHGIKVSILCPTYNHEKYISQALEGFVRQKTNFKFEVIIGDDCSTDRTPDIIQDYVDRYPDLFVFVRRNKNLGCRQNSLDLRRRVRGQYVALNEGDDYWTDPMKLQIQADYLDSHPECAVCFHPVLVIDEDKPKKQKVFPLIDQHLAGIKFSAEHLLRRNFIQTNSVMYRWQFHDLEDEGYTSHLQPGDWYNHLLHAQYGQIHLLEKVMSVYRKHPGGVWSTAKDHITRMKKWGNEHIHFFRTVNHNLVHKYHFHLLFSMKSMFIDLAKEYFEKLDIFNLYDLIDKNRDIAPIAFYYLDWPIDINTIFSSQDLIDEFRKVFTISTVITSYNQEEYIEQCLESVVYQKGFFAHEVIIADDFSTDKTTEIIDKYAKAYPDIISVIPTSKNLGMLQNLQRAFTACQGNFIAICEGDDYWLSPTKLHKQLLFLLKKPELPMCFNWLLIYKPSEQTFKPHPQQEKINSDRITFDQLLPVDLPANFSCCFYRRKAIESIPNSYYQEARAADWLFNLCIAHKADLGFIKELLSVYRLHEKGQWSGLSLKEQADRMQKGYQRFMEYFPDRKKYIQNFIRDDYDLVSNYKTPSYLEDCQDKNTFCNIDKLESIYGVWQIRGWFLNINCDSSENENKFLFIIDENGKVCWSGLLDNQNRQDVESYYSTRFHKKVTFRNWSGFTGIFNPQLSDGLYRLGIGKYSDGRLIYKTISKLFEVTKGRLTIN